ncbi:MAG: hypothetical protein ABIA75_14925 [Candidatus Neomarinimicrobiota bacterium]
MRLKIIFISLIVATGLASGQPGLEFGAFTGWYQPELTGLDTSLESAAASGNVLRKNVLLGYGVAFQLFPSARVGFAQGGSYYSGQDDTTSFRRKIVYRMFYVETYFRPLRRLELNFQFAPMINRGVINLDIKNEKTVWDAQIGNYRIDVKAPEKMTTTFFGFSSQIGVRYYLLSWLAVDLKTGFMSNSYQADNWKLDGKKISGPVLQLDQKAIYTIRLLLVW